jgi:hypothetical protein
MKLAIKRRTENRNLLQWHPWDIAYTIFNWFDVNKCFLAMFIQSQTFTDTLFMNALTDLTNFGQNWRLQIRLAAWRWKICKDTVGVLSGCCRKGHMLGGGSREWFEVFDQGTFLNLYNICTVVAKCSNLYPRHKGWILTTSVDFIRPSLFGFEIGIFPWFSETV